MNLYKSVLFLWIGGVIVIISFWIGVGYIALHFISRWW